MRRAMGVVVLALFALLAVGAAVARTVAAGAASRRARLIERIVTPLGLSFTDDDTLALIDHRFDLFYRGERPRVRNVVSGTWEGVEIAQAELWFAGPPPDERRSRLSGVPSVFGDVGESRLRFSFAVVSLFADLPHVVITRTSIAPTLPVVRLESEDFERRWQVGCADAEFAFRLVTPPMMEWLLDDPGPFLGFEVHGAKLLAYARLVEPAQVPAMVAGTKGFCDRIPKSLGVDYAVPRDR
jgi:hypothetical protein